MPHILVEYVWCDLYVTGVHSRTKLAEAKGIYGNSSWRFVNKGEGYAIEK
jgi:hypothetical protein